MSIQPVVLGGTIESDETAKNVKTYEAARTAFTIHMEDLQLPHAFVLELSRHVKPQIWRDALDSALRKLRQGKL